MPKDLRWSLGGGQFRVSEVRLHHQPSERDQIVVFNRPDLYQTSRASVQILEKENLIQRAAAGRRRGKHLRHAGYNPACGGLYRRFDPACAIQVMNPPRLYGGRPSQGPALGLCRPIVVLGGRGWFLLSSLPMYRGTAMIRNRPNLAPSRRFVSRARWWS